MQHMISVFHLKVSNIVVHKLLDKESQKIIYSSAVRPITKGNPNHRLTMVEGSLDHHLDLQKAH